MLIFLGLLAFPFALLALVLAMSKLEERMIEAGFGPALVALQTPVAVQTPVQTMEPPGPSRADARAVAPAV